MSWTVNKSHIWEKQTICSVGNTVGGIMIGHHERTVRKKTGGAQWKIKNYNISEFQRKWNIS